MTLSKNSGLETLSVNIKKINAINYADRDDDEALYAFFNGFF